MVRRTWGIGPRDFVIGCVANLKPRKGIEDLIRAFAAVPPNPASRLVLVGEGPLRDALVGLAAELGVAERVHFHGSDPDPTRLLAGMDLFVHPSETEGLPNAVLEAAAAGLAIVATDAGGTREIVRSGETGILVSVGGIEEMTEAITLLRCEADQRARLGAAAREHVRAAYGMERFVDETAALYRRLAARDGSGGRQTDGDAREPQAATSASAPSVGGANGGVMP
jgi:glycosyltransferase involved in cell wall biosynthesis